MAMAMHRVTPPGVCVLARLDRLAPKPPDDGVDGVERELVGRPRAAVDPRQETQHGASPPAARGAHAARAWPHLHWGAAARTIYARERALFR